MHLKECPNRLTTIWVLKLRIGKTPYQYLGWETEWVSLLLTSSEKCSHVELFPLLKTLKGSVSSVPSCLISLTMQKFRTFIVLHSLVQFLTSHSRVVVLLQLLARTAWGIKQAQGTSAHLNHPSKRVCLRAKPATQATLLIQLRGCTEEGSCESPKEVFTILIWTNLDWNQPLSSEAGRDMHASTHAQRKWVKRKHFKAGQTQENLFNLTAY